MWKFYGNEVVMLVTGMQKVREKKKRKSEGEEDERSEMKGKDGEIRE